MLANKQNIAILIPVAVNPATGLETPLNTQGSQTPSTRVFFCGCNQSMAGWRILKGALVPCVQRFQSRLACHLFSWQLSSVQEAVRENSNHNNR